MLFSHLLSISLSLSLASTTISSSIPVYSGGGPALHYRTRKWRRVTALTFSRRMRWKLDGTEHVWCQVRMRKKYDGQTRGGTLKWMPWLWDSGFRFLARRHERCGRTCNIVRWRTSQIMRMCDYVMPPNM